MYYRTNDLFDFSESQVRHILISVTTLSGILAFGLQVPLAYPVFYFSLITWIVIVGALILKGGLEISASPRLYLGLATILLVITFKTFLLGLALAVIFVVIFVVMVQQINNKPNEKQRKTSIFRDNNYNAIKLDSVSVAPLDEIDINAFRNTAAYKKVQEAYNKKTIKQYASY